MSTKATSVDDRERGRRAVQWTKEVEVTSTVCRIHDRYSTLLSASLTGPQKMSFMKRSDGCTIGMGELERFERVRVVSWCIIHAIRPEVFRGKQPPGAEELNMFVDVV
jgi:hypothetical protein